MKLFVFVERGTRNQLKI